MIIKSVWNKNKNNYYYDICPGKASNKLPKNKFLYEIKINATL